MPKPHGCFFVLREGFMCAAVKMGYSVNLPIEGGG